MFFGNAQKLQILQIFPEFWTNLHFACFSQIHTRKPNIFDKISTFENIRVQHQIHTRKHWFCTQISDPPKIRDFGGCFGDTFGENSGTLRKIRGNIYFWSTFTVTNSTKIDIFRLCEKHEKHTVCNIIFTRENIDFTPEKLPDFRGVTTRNFDTCHFSPPDTPEISRFFILFVLKNLIFDLKFGIFPLGGNFAQLSFLSSRNFASCHPPKFRVRPPKPEKKAMFLCWESQILDKNPEFLSGARNSQILCHRNFEKNSKKNMLTKKATSSSKRETLGNSEKWGCLTMFTQKCVLQHFLQKIRKFSKKN